MPPLQLSSAMICIDAAWSVATAAPLAGPLAKWNFNAGTGVVAADSSGKGHDAALHGTTWIEQGCGPRSGAPDLQDPDHQPMLDYLGRLASYYEMTPFQFAMNKGDNQCLTNPLHVEKPP